MRLYMAQPIPLIVDRKGSVLNLSLNNPEKMIELTNVGHEFVRLNFDVRKMVQDIEDLYEKLLNKYHNPLIFLRNS